MEASKSQVSEKEQCRLNLHQKEIDVIWSTLIQSGFVEVKCVSQLSPSITSLCDEYGLTCHSSMCGFVAVAIASYISHKQYHNSSSNNNEVIFNNDSLNDLLSELRNEEILLPYIRSAVNFIAERRDKYLVAYTHEFSEERDRENYRRTLVGGQEIAEWVSSGSQLSSAGVTYPNDEFQHRPVFLRNIATGPPGEVNIRYSVEEYQKHADERHYITQEFPFCDGADFFVQTCVEGDAATGGGGQGGTCISLKEWCENVTTGKQPCVPLIADFWGHYSTIFPVRIDLSSNNDTKIVLVCLDSSPSWKLGNWPHPKALLRFLQPHLFIDTVFDSVNALSMLENSSAYTNVVKGELGVQASDLKSSEELRSFSPLCSASVHMGTVMHGYDLHSHDTQQQQSSCDDTCNDDRYDSDKDSDGDGSSCDFECDSSGDCETQREELLADQHAQHPSHRRNYEYPGYGSEWRGRGCVGDGKGGNVGGKGRKGGSGRGGGGRSGGRGGGKNKKGRGSGKKQNTIDVMSGRKKGFYANKCKF